MIQKQESPSMQYYMSMESTVYFEQEYPPNSDTAEKMFFAKHFKRNLSN